MHCIRFLKCIYKAIIPASMNPFIQHLHRIQVNRLRPALMV